MMDEAVAGQPCGQGRGSPMIEQGKTKVDIAEPGEGGEEDTEVPELMGCAEEVEAAGEVALGPRGDVERKAETVPGEHGCETGSEVANKQWRCDAEPM